VSTETVAVTGATGNIGKRLVLDLLARGLAVRAVGRSADRLRELEKAGAEPAVGSVEDADFLGRAYAGAGTVFTLIPPHYTAADWRRWQNRVADAMVAALERARVGRVVNLSSVGAQLPAGTGPIAGLHDAEQRLDRLQADVLHLRPAYFMENHLHAIAVIRDQGVNGSAVRADVEVPMIATRDIAAHAAGVIASWSHRGKGVHELLGPRDYDMAAATRILGQAIGRPDLRYVQFPEGGVRQALVAMGMSASVAEAMVEMNRAFNQGLVRPTAPRTARSTTPTTLEQFATEVFAPAFEAGGR
jgi:uncharacterized protein YbjT (DUF2867 family)